jgi:4-alpha-glucanotransferase
MRLFRLFWIPDGMKAKDGAYVRDRAEDLLRILALESTRGRFLVVGEDLGTVESRVREELERFGVLSYRVIFFESDAAGTYRRPEQYPRSAVACSTTHDLPTLAGFWVGRDIEARRTAGLLSDEKAYEYQLTDRASTKQHLLDFLFAGNLLPDWAPRKATEIPELTGELHNAIIGALCQTRSMLMVLNQEDLTKEIDQQNLPGSTWQYPNWRRKMRYAIEELHTDQHARDFSAMLSNWLRQTGRLDGL